MSLSYCFASGKGGVGKSTLAANLGAALSQSGHTVTIIDTDFGLRAQDALLSLENQVVYNLLDVCNGNCALEQAMISNSDYPLLRLIPAPQFSRARALDPRQFRKVVLQVKQISDYVFIDCPAGIEKGFRNVLNAGVDRIILIVTPDDICVRDAERTAQVIEAKHAPRPLLIVNRVDHELVRRNEMMPAGAISDLLDLELLGVVPEDPAVYRSILRHTMLVNYDCEARRAVLRIISRLQGITVPLSDIEKKRHSFLRRLFSYHIKEVTPIDYH